MHGEDVSTASGSFHSFLLLSVTFAKDRSAVDVHAGFVSVSHGRLGLSTAGVGAHGGKARLLVRFICFHDGKRTESVKQPFER